MDIAFFSLSDAGRFGTLPDPFDCALCGVSLRAHGARWSWRSADPADGAACAACRDRA